MPLEDSKYFRLLELRLLLPCGGGCLLTDTYRSPAEGRIQLLFLTGHPGSVPRLLSVIFPACAVDEKNKRRKDHHQSKILSAIPLSK